MFDSLSIISKGFIPIVFFINKVKNFFNQSFIVVFNYQKFYKSVYGWSLEVFDIMKKFYDIKINMISNLLYIWFNSLSYLSKY